MSYSDDEEGEKEEGRTYSHTFITVKMIEYHAEDIF
jgi:hypothetical protein